MDCEAYREQIFRSADGELSAGEQNQLDAHLAECAECRAVWDALAAVSSELKELAPAPEGFAAAVMNRIDEENKIIKIKERRARLKQRFQPGNLAIWVACACLIIMIGIVKLTPVGHTKSSSESYFMADQAAVFESAEADGNTISPVAEEAADEMSLAAAEAPAENAVAWEPDAEASLDSEAAASAQSSRSAAEAPTSAVMVNGCLYCTTGESSPVEVADSAVLGEISSVVPQTEWPQEDGQANFEALGAPYAQTEDGLLVLLDSEWTLFTPITE